VGCLCIGMHGARSLTDRAGKYAQNFTSVAALSGRSTSVQPLAVMARRLLHSLAMKRSAEVVTDMMTLARLHAALDSVTDTEQMIAQIHESSAISPPTVVRVGELVAEARELLRSLLATPKNRHDVRMASMRRDPDGW
jgi:hypothetical protein